MHIARELRPAGSLTLLKFSAWPTEPRLHEIIWHGVPRPGLEKGVALWRLRNLPNLWRGAWRVLFARTFGIPHHYGVLWLDKITPNGRVAYGLASMRVVTDTGATKIVDCLRGLDTQATTFKFHGFGVGTNAEAVGDTALQTEETTQYAVDNTRPTGSQTNNGAKVYRTVGTYSPDSGTSPRPITEHGIFHQAATGAGSLLDRSVFSVMNLTTNADSLQATYDFTVNSGG